MSEISLAEKLKMYAASGALPMHMPGHKRNAAAFPWLAELGCGIDVTEIEGFDDLNDPRGLFAELEARAARIFGADESVCLVNGSTVGVLAYSYDGDQLFAAVPEQLHHLTLMGIVCEAIGRLMNDPRDTSAVLSECASMTQGLIASDFAGLTPDRAVTVGQRLYLLHGITGIRGQAEAGFPAVREAGLPVLKNGISMGLSVNDAGCAALLALMTAATDTNLIARSSLETQQRIVHEIKDLLIADPYPDTRTLTALDREFISLNLSPGGSADLLAICYLLYFLEHRDR